MKNLLILTIGALLAIGNVTASEIEVKESNTSVNSPKSLKERYSYGMGVNSASRFNEKKVPVDRESFLLSLKHVQNKQALLLKPDEIKSVIEQFKIVLGSGDFSQLDKNIEVVANSTLSTFKQQYSYAMGRSAANKLKEQGIDLELASFSLGMKHVDENIPVLMGSEDISAAIKEIKAQINKKKTAELHQAALENEKVAIAFFAENAKKEGVIETASGLQYQVLKAGGNSKKPSMNDQVKVNYRGHLLDGSEFDNSYKKGNPVVVTVEKMILGWAEALKNMTVGAKWRLFIPPELAYGVSGNGGAIGPNETLIFEVELLELIEKKPLTMINQ